MIRQNNPVGAKYRAGRASSTHSIEYDRPVDWTQKAACRGIDPELFYLHKKASFYDEVTADLRALCGGCPVQVECLSATVREERHERSLFGFRAGLTDEERLRLRRSALRTDVKKS